MNLNLESIKERLMELDRVTAELKKYKTISAEELSENLSLRWTIERGLIAGISIILDITLHILSSKFSVYPSTYEEGIRELYRNRVISESLYLKLKGIGSFRNILVHEYIKIDPKKVFTNFLKFLEISSDFTREIILFIEHSSS